MQRDDERAGRREPDREDLRDEEELRVQRTEEELRAGTREREAGEVRVRKQVRTEHEQVRVPKRHEEVSVERVPDYRALKADERTWERAHRPKRCLLAKNSRLRNVVAKKLKEDWSPQQISGWLYRRYYDDGAMRVSHETIYRTCSSRPGAQCLGANAQIAGYLRNGMLFLGSLNQPDGFLLEFRRIPSACLLAHLRPLSRNLIA